MRVLHVDTATEWRGGQTQLEALLSARRDDHVVLHPDAPVRPALEALGCTVHTVRFAGTFRGTRRLRSVIRDVRPDLVAAHTSHAHHHAVLAAPPTPVVVHRRVDFAVGGNPLSRLQYRRATGFVAVSEAVRQVLVRGGVDPEVISVVHDGVDPVRVASTRDRDEVRAELGVPVDGLLVGSVGALVPHKGHAHLVEALAWLDNDRQDIWGVLIGDGPERSTLQGRIDEWKIGERTRILGERSDVADLLGALDLFVHPSVEEGMGQAIVEAMLAGVPIVASSAGGIPEVLDDLTTALLVAPGDGAALSRAMLAALRATERSRQRAEAACHSAAERFSVTRMVEGTEAAYARFLGTR